MDEKELVRRLKSGDKDAFDALYEKYKNILLRMAYLVSGQMYDAEDIVQQAFADVWDKNINNVLIENLKSYMYQAVRNRSLSLVTQPVELQTTDQFPDMEDSSEEEHMYNAERDARLWNAIDGLPPERKKIFLLSKRDGLKYQEIAEELNISIKTVENQMG